MDQRELDERIARWQERQRPRTPEQVEEAAALPAKPPSAPIIPDKSWPFIVELPEAGYVIRWRYGGGHSDLYIDLEAYEAWFSHATYLQRADSHTHPDMTDLPLDFDSAERFLACSIKWDGCIDLTWDNAYVHLCGPENVARLNLLLAGLYDAAKQGMPERADW